MDEKLRNILIIIITGLILSIYLYTIAPSVIQIDSGELATVQCLPGIAHPSGYPLFTLLGYLFSLLPFPTTKIFQLNLLSMGYTLIALIIFYRICLLILDNLFFFSLINSLKISKKKNKSKSKNKNKSIEFRNIEELPGKEIQEVDKLISAALATLILAFSSTFWFQSVAVEVYSLHLLLISLIIYLLLKAYTGNQNGVKSWIVFSVALGLGFTNHLTTILIIPASAYLFFNRRKFNKLSLTIIAKMFAVFLCVFVAIYSILPIIASLNPALNWGNPIDLERILRHISGKQYQVWIFSSIDSAKKQFIYFLNNLPKEFFLSLIIILPGVIISFLKYRKLFYFIFLLFSTTIIYSINYDIVDIDSYFLLAYIALCIWSVMGLHFIISRVSISVQSRYIITAILVMLISIQAYTNYKNNNQNGNFVFEDYSKSALASVEEGAVIFSYQWDYLISPAYYFQFVEHFRKDVAVIDKELLRRSWYYNQLERNYPDVTKGVYEVKNQFLEAVQPFERDEKYNSETLEILYRQIMTKLVATNYPQKNYYIGPELVLNELAKGEFSLPKGLKIVPHLFFFKIADTDDYQPAGDFYYTFRKSSIINKYTSFIRDAVPNMLLRRIYYELQHEKYDRALHYIKAIKTNFPEYRIPSDLLNLESENKIP